MAPGQGKQDILIFDEDDAVGAGYYDASFGFASSGSTLIMAGSGNDKLKIDSGHSYTGTQSGVLEWTSVPAGNWRMFVASPNWTAHDASGYDSLVFYLNSRGAVTSASLPRVGLEDLSNVSTPLLPLGSYLPSGTDGDTTTWARVSNPLSAFQPFGAFSLSKLKDVNFGQGDGDGVRHTLWFDNVRIVALQSTPDTTLPPAPSQVVWRAGDRSVVLHWDHTLGISIAGYNVYRSLSPSGPFQKSNGSVLSSPSFADLDVTNGTTYAYIVKGVNLSAQEGPSSATVQVTPHPFVDDNEFLDYCAQTAIDFSWYEANPLNGLIKDGSASWSAASIASTGFGLTSLCVGIDRGWITRENGRNRTLTTLKTFWHQPQGPAASGIIGYKGWFYHWLDMTTGVRTWNSELSSIDTGLLLAGILDAKAYFQGADSVESLIRALADSIYRRVDWPWMANGDTSLTMGYFPESGFLGVRWRGYNEASILYILALGAESHPMPPSLWNYWVGGYSWQSYYGYDFVNFPPLFGHQYSQCWIDCRNIQDPYMTAKGITYFVNSRRATLAQRDYCIANPGGFPGYGPTLWGLTACDGPGTPGYFAYMARGAPPGTSDDGTIAPTAAGGSIAFAPEVVVPTLRNMYDTYRASIWTPYGFRDAFNLKADWWGPHVLGIDQIIFAIMIENYRTQSVWNRFKTLPEIQRGLQRAGFTEIPAEVRHGTEGPPTWMLEQNYPNPFNPSTQIRYALARPGAVSIAVYNVLGERVALLVNEIQSAGTHVCTFDAHALPSGTYFVALRSGGFAQARAMLLLR
jgi:hypothetical protein